MALENVASFQYPMYKIYQLGGKTKQNKPNLHGPEKKNEGP